MTTALITLSDEGARLLAPLATALPEARLYIHEVESSVTKRFRMVIGIRPDEADRSESAGDRPPEAERFTKIADLTASLFPVCRGLVYAAPCGVVVRAIAPLIRSKYEDPAVVVLDAGGRWAVSLLSGHEGGANALAIRVANILGAEPVITTTTEALKSVIVGIGCRRGTPAERIVAADPRAPWRRRGSPSTRSAFSPRPTSRRTRRGCSPPRRRSASRSASSPRRRSAPRRGNFRIRHLWKKR